MAERDRLWRTRVGLGEPTEWQMTNATFFTAFVGIAAVLTVMALVLRS